MIKELHTHPQTEDLEGENFFKTGLLDKYDLFYSRSFNSMPEMQGDYQMFSFEPKCDEEKCLFRFPPSPEIDSDYLFQFPEVNKVEASQQLGKANTCVTQNGIGIKMDSEIKHDKTTYAPQIPTTSQTVTEEVSATKREVVPRNENADNRDIGKTPKVVRRDVVNKTIFRIIRRFFHQLLSKAVPDYKHQKKANLKQMLISFSEFLFPQFPNSSKMSEVMSCLMFRRELLLAKDPVVKDSSLKVFLDIQSKYSHKLLPPVLSNI